MLETSFLILSAAFLLLVICCIPLFWQIWRTVKDMAAVLGELNRNLPDILASLGEITVNIKAASRIIKYEAETLTLLGDKLRVILHVGKNMENIIRQGVSSLPLWDTYKMARALLRGVTVFFDEFFKKGEGGPRGKR